MTRQRAKAGSLLTAAVIAGVAVVGLCTGFLALLITPSGRSDGCDEASASGPGSIVLGPPGTGRRVGATEYGGPGDPSTGVAGARGDNLLAHPDSYAELGGLTWQTATAMGGLPYMAPLRITWGEHSAIAYKRDFGFGGSPIDGLPRVIDLWWQLAERLGIPYDRGLWSGAIMIERPPAAGSGDLLAAVPQASFLDASVSTGSASPASPSASACSEELTAALPLTPGPRAALMPDGLAEAPRDAPLAVKEIVAAGNQIVGKPYVYGAAHGLPLSEVASAYDCSSSVEHLLYGAGLLPVDYGAASSAVESFGAAGPGQWVSVYASPDHVFMYVAGLRWDTHNAAGDGDGSAGIGWHPLVRSSAGFVARHPVGL